MSVFFITCWRFLKFLGGKKLKYQKHENMTEICINVHDTGKNIERKLSGTSSQQNMTSWHCDLFALVTKVRTVCCPVNA